MTYLLDTNAWIRFFHQPEQLSERTRNILATEDSLGLSPYSVVELPQKQSNRRKQINLPLPLERWIDVALTPNRIHLMPVTPAVAIRAYQFHGDFHGDPADRVIAATAIVNGLTLVTADKQLLAHPDVPTLSTR